MKHTSEQYTLYNNDVAQEFWQCDESALGSGSVRSATFWLPGFESA